MASRVPTHLPPPAPPSDRERGHGGGKGGWALLCTVGDRYEAEMIRGLLETNDLGPVVIDPIPTVGAWMLPSGHERIPQRVLVLAAVLDAAKLALLEAGFDADPDADDADFEIDDGDDPRRVSARWPVRAAGLGPRVTRWIVLVAFAIAVAGYLARLMRGTAGIP